MTTTIGRDPRFAILIDADNVSEKYVQIVLDEVATFGVATYKRIYGDWTSPRLGSWKTCLLDNSITPIQQYSYTYGKNATDSAMIIDAMDILYSGTVDGFAIVSSDSDFTRLVARLREGGMQVIGMGEQKTPKPFIAACNQFKYLDLLLATQKAEEAERDAADAAEEGDQAGDQVNHKSRRRRGRRRKAGETGVSEGAAAQCDEVVEDETASEAGSDSVCVADDASGSHPTHPRRRPGDRGLFGAVAIADDEDAEASDEDEADEPDFGQMSRADRRRHLKALRTTIGSIVDTFSDDDGWVSLGQLGDQLGKRQPDFDVRNYGYKRLHPFLKSLGVYEFEEPSGESGRRQIYLRVK